MTTFKLAAILLGGLTAGAVVAGPAALASADDADSRFLDGLAYLSSTGFDVDDYDRNELIATGHMVCDMFEQGKDSPIVSGAVVGDLNMWGVRNPRYNATWIVKGATAAYCPAYSAETGRI
ncbi:DUF732 domain-containing protein [Mycolicibacterium novocastrense]|uniref:DUF732 domain-containing protein n=1 Tax=Mycolicibacterium novocastrense TaxID=59813 RepID=A0AAW5SE89_MYCNV|nr:DUF732 domain-containing protein [Mycolicibacterium novocastrense]MCV7021811.1 DUF732 domain-containing protein [Mycolicibacterium novocastrense]GAT11757.1 uncharacterized protein RMCN_4890 [Mycolicibacterium novocastrense]